MAPPWWRAALAALLTIAVAVAVAQLPGRCTARPVGGAAYARTLTSPGFFHAGRSTLHNQRPWPTAAPIASCTP